MNYQSYNHTFENKKLVYSYTNYQETEFNNFLLAFRKQELKKPLNNRMFF